MEEIIQAQKQLTQHAVYKTLGDLTAIRHFMRYHVFAVWDFMTLLKSLQNHLTCTRLPWVPSEYPAEAVRLINQIVLGEESDLDQNGEPISHFELYLRGMEEVGSSTSEIKDFLATLDLAMIPTGAREFVRENLEVAMKGHIVEVAAYFFFGREKLIPDMFHQIIQTLEQEKIHAPTFIYYLKRHIEVDSEEHGPLAMRCLDILTKNEPTLKDLAVSSGLKALESRRALWNKVLENFQY